MPSSELIPGERKGRRFYYAASLIALRFLNTEFTVRDVAKFLKITERHAYNIIAWMKREGYIIPVLKPGKSRRAYTIIRLPGIALRIIERIDEIQEWLQRMIV
ncbi:MAG: hypothetical protein DRI26_00120 [Chloroflexi bacterium]|nr:MAG: hypothetical protein DRI26_00120 [Chloroflexota bacterium]